MGAGSPAFEAWGTMFALLKRFCGDRRAAIAIYSAYAGTLLIGACALSIDIGRVGVLRTQLQNAADQAALAGAAQLDGQAGARNRARNVARFAATQSSGILSEGDALEVKAAIQIYSTFSGGYNFQIALTDANARYIRVDMVPAQATLMFQPILQILSGSSSSSSVSLNAHAVAEGTPITCDPVPMRICEPLGLGGLTNPANIGRELILKEAHAADFENAVFDLLCQSGAETCDLDAASAYMAALSDNTCQLEPGAPPATAGAPPAYVVNDGINVRFAEGSYAASGMTADSVIEYPNDANVFAGGSPISLPDALDSGGYGDGNWNPGAYWPARHNGDLLPVVHLGSQPTRYQVYLYEIGATFATNGNQTLYPVPDPLPDGFTPISGPLSSIPQVPAGNPAETNEQQDGIPDACDQPNSPSPSCGSAMDAKRRTMLTSAVTCGDEAPVFIKYIEIFLTRKASNNTIFAEVVGEVPSEPPTEVISNVRLVE